MLSITFPIQPNFEQNIITKSYYESCSKCVVNNFDEEYIKKILQKNLKKEDFNSSKNRRKNFKNALFKSWKINIEPDDQKLLNVFESNIKKYNSLNEKNKIYFSEKLYKNGFISSSFANIKNFPTNEFLYEYDKYKNDRFLKQFDLNQISGLNYGSPVKILYLTKDKNWALILTSEKSIGFTNASNLKKESNLQKHKIIQYHENKILDFNKDSLMSFFEKHIGIPYSWGNSNLNKFDCSSIIKEYFARFGVFMNRNSFAQINQKNIEKISIPKNLDANQRKKFIIKNAKPFKSVLYFKGHIMLYLGEDPKKPGDIIVFHSISSINAKNKKDKKNLYKFFILESVIGNLPDEEFFSQNTEFEPIKEKNMLIDRISAIGNIKEL